MLGSKTYHHSLHAYFQASSVKQVCESSTYSDWAVTTRLGMWVAGLQCPVQKMCTICHVGQPGYKYYLLLERECEACSICVTDTMGYLNILGQCSGI